MWLLDFEAFPALGLKNSGSRELGKLKVLKVFLFSIDDSRAEFIVPACPDMLHASEGESKFLGPLATPCTEVIEDVIEEAVEDCGGEKLRAKLVSDWKVFDWCSSEPSLLEVIFKLRCVAREVFIYLVGKVALGSITGCEFPENVEIVKDVGLP